MSAKPSPLPDPDLSPTKGETQDRRKVGLKKGTITKSAQRAFDDIGAHVEYEQEMGGRPPEDTIIPDRTTPEEFQGPKPLVKPLYQYGDKLPKNRGIPIPHVKDRGTKYPVSAKSGTSKSAKKPDNHSYKVKWT